jgi:hypothetical protein
LQPDCLRERSFPDQQIACCSFLRRFAGFQKHLGSGDSTRHSQPEYQAVQDAADATFEGDPRIQSVRVFDDAYASHYVDESEYRKYQNEPAQATYGTAANNAGNAGGSGRARTTNRDASDLVRAREKIDREYASDYLDKSEYARAIDEHATKAYGAAGTQTGNAGGVGRARSATRDSGDLLRAREQVQSIARERDAKFAK